MKIAILLPDLRGGGAERVSVSLAREFARRGHRVEFVLMQCRGEFLAEAEAAHDVHALAAPRARHVPLALARYLRQSRPDALLAAMWPLTVIAPAARLLSGHDCQVVVSEHSMLATQVGTRSGRLQFRAAASAGYRLADAVVAVSDGVARQIAALSFLGASRVRTIHNPVPLPAQPKAEDLRRAEMLWGTPRGERILTVGTFKPVKNQSLLIRAFACLGPGARLMLLGAGPLEADLRALAHRLGVADRVLFPGFRPDPTPFYRTADLFVLSSDSEGFGNVIVEALACGLPVVCTDCASGPAEILEHGSFGRLVPVGDEAALASAIREALARPADPAPLIARATDFAPEIAAERYLDLLGPAQRGAECVASAKETWWSRGGSNP